jgi:hypothetical protein
MEKLLLQMLEAAKKDKASFIALKNLTIKCQQFELSVAVKELEKELFPETEEIKQAKVKAAKLSTALSMVELRVDNDVCWLISEVFEAYAKLGGTFSIEDAVELRLKKERIFLKS